MPVEDEPGYDYFSQTPDIPSLKKNVELFTQSIYNHASRTPKRRLLPKYEDMLKQKLSKISVTIEFREYNDQASSVYSIYKNRQEIGKLEFYCSPNFEFYFRTRSEYNGSRSSSSSNPTAIALRPVGKILDGFVEELARIVTSEKIRPVVENKASVTALKDATGNVDVARNIGRMSGIVPNVRGVDIGQGRKRKTRKLRSRKQKKTRKH